MEVSGSTSIKLAFDLNALEKLADPNKILDSSRQWSANIGIISDRSDVDIENFKFDCNLKTEFTTGPRELEETTPS